MPEIEERHVPSRPFSDAEIDEIRQLLETQHRLHWVGKWVRNIAIYVTALVTGWVAFGKSIKEALGL